MGSEMTRYSDLITQTVGRPLPRQWIIGKKLVDGQFETKKVVNSQKQNKPCH